MNTNSRLLLISILLVFVLLWTGCAPTPEEAPAEMPEQPQVVETEETLVTEEETVLTVAFNSGVANLDPAVACDNEAGTVLLNVFDQLVQKGITPEEDGSFTGSSTDIQPMLATSWTISPDAREFTFKIRDGIKFTNGNVLDANAVKYSLDRTAKMLQCGEYALTAGLSGNIESVEAPDNETVVVRLKESDPLFLEALTLFPSSIVDPAVVEAHGGVVEGETNEYMAGNAVGSGRYMITTYDPETEIVLEANPEYWGEKPKSDRIVIKVVKDPSTRELLLRSGELDVAFRVPSKNLARFEEEGFQIIKHPSPEITYLGFNNTQSPLDDVKLREALLYAVPYEALVEDVLHGYGSQLIGPIPSTMAYYCEDVTYPYELDLEKAQELLSESGYESAELSLDVRAGFTEHEEIAVILQNNLKQIGIDLTINKLNTAEYQDRVWNFKSEMFLADDQPWINDPGYNLGYNLPCGEYYNWGQYCNEQVDQWLLEARHETDTEKRRQLYCDISQQFIDDAPWIMLFVRDETVIMPQNVKGYLFDPSGAHPLYTLEKTN